jgi:hypothetical protein
VKAANPKMNPLFDCGTSVADLAYKGTPLAN